MKTIKIKLLKFFKAPHFTVIGVAIFASAWLIYYLNSRSDIINNHVGIFYSNYAYPINIGEISIEGTTEYFENGGYNFIGKMQYQIEVENEITILDYMVTAAGDWESSKDRILYTIREPHLQPVGFKSTNKALNNSHNINVEKLWIEKLSSNLSDVINTGSVSKFIIIDEKNGNIWTKTRGPNGNMYDVFMRKVDKPFSLLLYVGQR